MLRLFLILLLCALFAACSSDDDSGNLKEWFDSQHIATSYGKIYDEIDVSFKDYSLGYDSSAFMISSFGALGNANNVEQMLYFGLEVAGKPDSVWRLRTDSVFYANFYDGKVPEEHKKLEAIFSWREESKTEHDTTWLKFQNPFTNSANISIDWKAGGTRDTFSISLPEEFLKLKANTLRLLAGIRLLANNAVLRIAPPSTSDIPGLLRVAQKTQVKSCGDLCLHAGVRESLDVVLEVEKNKIKTDKTIVFAQLVLPKPSDTTGSELGFTVPIYVYYEDYRIDTAFVNNYGHPNLVFRNDTIKYDTLKLQVTRSLRSYASTAILPDTLGFTLRLGNIMPNPKSLSFSNIRPAYSGYDFGTAFEGAKLRLWYAETDFH